MKNKYLILSVIVLAAIAAVVMAAIPAPPVNQQIGMPDVLLGDLIQDTAQCKQCHTTAASDIHHFMVGKRNTRYGCADCHPNQGTFPNQVMYVERECKACHNATAFAMNPVVNITQVRPPGRPHHNQTKNSSSNVISGGAMPLGFAYLAIDRQCNVCHGSGFIANYNDGHAVPTYLTGLVTPFADFRINKTVSGDGREYGGCYACHDEVASEDPEIVAIQSPYDLHHGQTSGMLGRQCNYCHVGDPNRPRAEPIPDRSPEPNAYYKRIFFNDTSSPYYTFASMFGWDTSQGHLEIRNSTLLAAGDLVNGTGCQKCHSVALIHNIQAAAPGLTVQETIDAQIPGYGHVANNSDCDGCHQGWAAVTDANPFAGPTAMSLDRVVPSKLTANVATDVTLTGFNFVQAGYTTQVLVDGVPTTPKSITDSSIVVTLNPAVGGHYIQVEKGGITSRMTTVMALAPGTIASATLTDGVITITGTGLGADQTMVVINHGGVLKASDSITETTDTRLVAVSASAAVGDNVLVETPTGEATATITAGTVPPAIDSAVLVVPKKSTTGTLTITGTGLGSSGTRNDVYIETTNRKGQVTKSYANSITSWASDEIVAVVAKNWAGRTVNVNVGGTVVRETIT